MSKNKGRKILLLPGDGIGPEVVNEVRKVIEWLNKNKSFKSQRFAEGGSNDLGDIQLIVGDEEYFIEAKSRQNLNIHQSLDKAIDKSGSTNTILFWKKLKKRDGNSRRSSDGIPEVVTMSYDLFVKLMNK